MIHLAWKLRESTVTYRRCSGSFWSPCDAGAGGWQVRTGYVLLPLNSRRRFPNLQRAARIRTRKIIAARRKLGNQIHTITRHIHFLYTAWLIGVITILWRNNKHLMGRRLNHTESVFAERMNDAMIFNVAFKFQGNDLNFQIFRLLCHER